VTEYESPDSPQRDDISGDEPVTTLVPPPVPPPAPPSPLGPPLAPLPIQPDSLPILVALPDRAKQRRWTVLLRAILAIPLAVVVVFVGIAALVCVVVGWFAAIFMGRAPEFARDIVTIFLRMSLRLEAYLFLLTDRFPPFGAADAPEYPSSVAVPPVTRLNRAAVLFRLVLIVPATIVLRVVGLGLYVLAFFMWVVVLITGWLPKPVHEAYGAFVRYEMRLTGYLWLLVPTYPGRLFGDEPYPTPVLAPVGDVSGQYTSALSPAPPQRTWNLMLGKGAKRVLVLAIVLGAAALIGLQVLDIEEQNHENLVQVNNQLISSLNTFAASANQCGSVGCLERADGVLSQQLGSFVSGIQGSANAGVSQHLVDQVTTAAQNAQQVTDALANAGPTISGYRSVAARVHAAEILRTLISAQNRYATALNGS